MTFCSSMFRGPAAAMALSLTLIQTAPAAAQEVVTIGTNPAGTITNTAGSAIGKMLKDRGVEARLQPYAGSGPLMALVQQGKLDFAIVNVFEAGQAMKGEVPFAGTPHPDLRIVASIFQIYVGYVVPKQSPIKTMADIKGKRVPGGYAAAPIIDLMNKAMLANAGIGENEIELVQVPNSVRGADLMQQGRADLAFLSVGSGKVAEIDAAMGGVRYLSLSSDPKAVAAMRAIMPQGAVVPLKARENFVGIADGTGVLGVDQVLVTHRNASAKLVNTAIEVLTKDRAALGESLPLFKSLTDGQMAGVPNTPYHDAALATYKAMGLMR